MSAYREGFESCPRCTVALEDAGSARACPGCRGLWVAHEVVSEMIQRMLPLGQLGRLELAIVERADHLACPSCREAMAPTTIHEVILDSCSKGHGVWFDIDELELALRAVAAHGSPPFVPLARSPVVPIASPAAELGDEHADLPTLFLRQIAPTEQLAQKFRQPIIKVGKHASSHFRVPDDVVARMHAVIEMTPEGVWIIDLGCSVGTLVDGTAVAKAQLRDGTRLQFGSIVVEVFLEPPRK